MSSPKRDIITKHIVNISFQPSIPNENSDILQPTKCCLIFDIKPLYLI
jgi:hypothetical protein